jgi:hypothetical protein
MNLGYMDGWMDGWMDEFNKEVGKEVEIDGWCGRCVR